MAYHRFAFCVVTERLLNDLQDVAHNDVHPVDEQGDHPKYRNYPEPLGAEDRSRYVSSIKLPSGNQVQKSEQCPYLRSLGKLTVQNCVGSNVRP